MASTSEKIFIPKNADELRDQFLRDVRLAAIDTGITDEPPTQPGSDWFLLGTAVANIALIGLANTSIADDDSNVLNATGAALDQIREAEGLPEVTPSGSSGKIRPTILGSTTILNDSEIQLPNGLRIKVVGTYVNPTDGDELDVVAVDTGTATNAAGGTEVQFVSEPTNVAKSAIVSHGAPLTGGTDAETDDRKRDRILNTRRNKPAGGNWSHVRKEVLDGLGSIQDIYEYPALGGPGSSKSVPIKDFDPDNNDFSRACTSAMLNTVRGIIHGELGIPLENVVQAVANESADFTVKVTIPESSQNGGNGLGWTDVTPWPPLEGGDSGQVAVTSYTAATPLVVVDAVTATSPIAGQTHIAWWSSVDRKFYTALVTAVSGGTGAWSLTLERPLVGKNGGVPQAGDYISPAALNLGKYGTSWVNVFRKLGPGENTTDVYRLPRAKRHPFVTDEDPADINNATLLEFKSQHPEITNISLSYSPVTTPTVPASVNTAPNVLVPRRFGVYRL